MAINDGNLLKSAAYYLLKNRFGTHPAYSKMVESLQDIDYTAEMGQECNALASRRQGPEQWKMGLHDKITELKGGYYSFYLYMLLSLFYVKLD